VSTAKTVTITVTGTNDVPVAADSGKTTAENTVLASSVPAATDVDGTVANYQLVAGPGAGDGSLVFNSDGTYTFTPGTDFDALAAGSSRNVTFTYTATDNLGAVSVAKTVTITVTGTNDIPVAANASASTGENAVLSSNVPAATDVDGTVATYQLVAGPGAGNGTLVFNSTGTYTFTPGTDFDALAFGATRNVTFTYTATDNDGGVSVAKTVTITVTGTNDIPVAANGTATTAENAVLSSSVPVATDVDGTIASYQLVTGPGAGNGSVVVNTDGTYTFTPGTDFDALAVGASRNVTFTYTATDNNGGVSVARTVTITVTGTNDIPVAANATAGTTENAVLSSSVPAATDVDGTITNYQLVAGPGAGNGTLVFNSTGTYTFTPGTDFDALAVGVTRDVTFTYTATDNNGGVSTAKTVTITVTGTNDVPVAADSNKTTAENAALSSNVPAATDIDGTVASYQLVAGPGAGNGALLFNSDGTYTFTPGTDFDALAFGATRTATFTYTATDNLGAVSAAKTVTITVTGTNDAPVAADSGKTTGENAVLASNVPAATDVDGTVANYQLVAGPGAGNGTLAFNSDGTYTFTPGTDFDALAQGASRNVSFTYTATDNLGAVSAAKTVTITVTGTNDAPVAADSARGTVKTVVLNSNVPAATDVDGTVASYQLVADVGAGNGVLAFNAGGSYSFDPAGDFAALAPGQSRSVTFTYTATDNLGAVSTPKTVTITVSGNNLPPVASDSSRSTGENTVLASSVPVATDVDGTVAGYQLVAGPGAGNGSLVFNTDGTYTFTPGTDFDALAVGSSRNVTFTYTATDDLGAVSTAKTVTITVNGANDVPVASDSSRTTDENTVLASSVPVATDVDGTVANYQLVAGPGAGNGSLVFNSTGSYTFTPGADFDALAPGASRNVTFTYTATDNDGGVSVARTVTITVTGTNDIPVAANASAATGENTVLASSVPAATDVDGTIAGYQLVAGPGAGNGSLVFNGNGTYTFTPGTDFDALAAGATRTATFTYTATDNDGGVSTAKTVTLTVTGTNDIPVATNAIAGTTENAVLSSSVPAATDVDGTVANYQLVAGPGAGNGTLVFNGNGTYTFTPGTDFDALAAGATRDVTFTYTATDNDGGVSTAKTVTITVTGTNDAPVAADSSKTTGENTVLASNVPAATDVDGTIAGYQLVTGPGAGNGSLVFSSDGTYTFTPGTDFDALAAGASRAVTFTYSATDNLGAVSTARTVTITVTGTNDAPVAADSAKTTDENTVLASSVPVATDVDGTVAGYQLVAGPGVGNGSLVFNTNGTYTFAPGTDFDALAPGASRDVTFTYTATDNLNAVSTAKTVTITVTGTNDAPVAANAAATTAENTVLSSSVPAATDVDGTVASYQLVAGPGAGNGSLVLNSSGSYTFTPGTDFDALAAGTSRNVTFTYTATDNLGAVSTARTVTITVTGTNDVPVAANAVAGTTENAVLSSSVPPATDVDGTVANYQLVAGPGAGNGTLVFNSTGTYTFTPGADFDALAAGATRDVTFSYTATDNDGGVSTAKTVTITVTGTNDAPVAADSSKSTDENTVLASSVPAATDVDGTVADYQLVAGPGAGNGSVVFNADGTYTFTPGADFDALAVGTSRDVTFTYTATDNLGAVSAAKTVTITVTGTNDIPVAANAIAGTTENAVLSSNVPAATDADGTIANYQLVAGPGAGNGTLVFNSTGTYTFTPGTDFDALAAGATRNVTFTYTATDNDGGVSTARTVTITVTGTNDAPVAADASESTGENTVLTSNVPAATDVDGTIASYQLVAGPGAGNGSLVFNSSGSYTFTPGADFDALAAGVSRDVTFTYTATDNLGALSTVRTVTITVTGTNDLPVAANAVAGTTENAVLSSNVPAATDADGTVANYQLVAGPGAGNGALVFNSNGSYTFTPGADFDALVVGATRDVTFTYTATDDDGGVSTAKTVTITVTGTNDAPVASDSTRSTVKTATLSSSVPAATDVDGTVAGYQLVAGPGAGNGVLAFNADGTYSFDPASDFAALAPGQTRSVTFTYTATDNLGSVSAARTVTITVLGANLAPVATDSSRSTGENTVLASSVPVATDVDGTVAGYQLVSGLGAGNGSLVFNTDGSYAFTPGTDFDALAVGASRDVTFTYTATDNLNAVSAVKTVTITVTGSNDIPVAANAAAGTTENAVLSSGVPPAADVDGTIAGYQLVAGPGAGNGTLVFNGDGTYTFTPGADFDALAAGATRDVTFTYTATDNVGGVSTAKTVTITVTGTNDIPVAANAAAGTTENTVLASSVPAAADVDGSIANYQLVGGPGAGNGTLVFNSNGTYTFTPGTDFDALAPGATRDVTFTYTATDNDGGVSTAKTVTITVTGTNDIPVAANAIAGTTENAVLSSSVPAATDVDGTVASYQLVAGPGAGNGTLVFNSTGTYTFTPGTDFDALAAGATRVVTFSYTATDNDGGVSAARTVTLTVTGTNDAPIASDSGKTTDENTVLASSVPAATDVDGTVADYQLVAGPGAGNGTVVFNADGSYTFTPGADFDALALGVSRDVTFTYTATDNLGAVSAPRTVTITVTGANDAPVASDSSRTTDEDTVLASSVPVATDVDGTVTGYQLVAGPGAGNGSLVFNGNGTYTFTPGTNFDALAPGASRDVTFTYTATDNLGAVSAARTVTVTVTGTNDAPVASDSSRSTGENTVLSSSVPAGADVDGTVASYQLVAGPGAGNGSLVFGSSGSYTFTPGTDFDTLAPGASRTVTFTYTATDNLGAVSVAKTVTITVTGANDAPVAVDAAASTGENAVLASNVPAATDVDGTIANYQLVAGPGAGNGTLVFNSDGTYTFAPGTDFDALAAGVTRNVTFTYTATDNDGGVSAIKTVTLTVTGTNDAPVATDSGKTTDENTVLASSVPVATDVDGTIAGYQLVAGPGAGNGSVVFNADGTYTFAPGADFDALALGASRDVTFTYTARDNLGAVSAPRTVTITVTGANDAPVALDSARTTDESTALNASVPAATDVDGTVANYQLVAGPGAGNGTLVFNGNGTYTFTPGADFDALAVGSSRDVTFTYTATDNLGAASAPRTVTITVTGTNDAPVAADAGVSTGENAVLTSIVPAAMDVDGTITGYQLVAGPGAGNGTLVFNTDGTYTFTPGTDFDTLAAGASRNVTFTYTATDNLGAVSTARTVTITVNGANDNPVAANAIAGTAENAVLSSNVPAATDVDGTIANYQLVAGPGAGNGTLVFNSNGTYTFTPGTDFDALAAGATRNVTFTYTATDNDGGVSTAKTVTVTVTGTNDAPVASDSTRSTVKTATLSSSVPPAADVDGTIAGYQLVTGPGAGNGVLAFNADGTYSFDPAGDFAALAPGQTRSVTFTYTAMDNLGALSAARTVTITVTGDNLAPVAADSSRSTGENTVLASSVPLATDADGTVASYQVETGLGAGNGSLVFNSDGTYTFTPGTDFDALAVGSSRNVTFTYTATDNLGAVSTAKTVTITVTGTNDTPVAANAIAGTTENAVLSSSVPPATDVDGTVANYQLVAGPGAGNGTLVFNGNGTYTFTPGTDFDALAAGATRDVTFTYTATDNDGGVSTARTVTITVTGSNDAPVASDSSKTTDENTVLASSVPVATDVDGTIAGYQLVSGLGAGNGALVFNTDGTYTFTPGADFDALAAGVTRNVTFTYTAKDNLNAVSAPRTVTITVTGTNDIPVAANANAATTENAVLSSSVPPATDVDGTIANYQLVTGPGAGNGTLVFNSNGTYTFTPGTDFDALAAGATRDVTFSYTATDNVGGVSTAKTVTLTVTGTNDAPVASDSSKTTDENTVLASSVPVATDVDGTIAGYQLVAGPGAGNGALVFNTDGTYTFNPGTDFDGLAAGAVRNATFTYTATDNLGAVSTVKTVTIAVTGTNDIPVASNATAGTTENAVLASNVPAATDVDGTIANYQLVAGPGAGNGTLVFNSNGTYTFTPDTDFDALAAGVTRNVTFTYTATDNDGGVSTARTVTLTVTGTNDAPVASDSSRTTDENTVLASSVPVATDVDGTIASYQLVAGPGAGNGSLVFNTGGTYTFTPGTDFDALAAGLTRDVTFTYTATDNLGAVSAAKTVTITVTGTNDIPVAANAIAGTTENAVLSSNVPAATDVDGTIANYQLVAGLGAGNGTLVFNSNGTYTFTPGTDFDALAAGAARDVTFSYTATDNVGGVSTAKTVTLTVTGTNDAPVASDSSKTTDENTVLASSVPVATDVDGTIASYQLVAGPGAGNGSLVFNTGGTYTFAPGTDFDALAAGVSRDVTFTYTATDNLGAVSVAKTVTITVTGTNDIPVAANATAGTTENAVLSSNVPAATDVDGTIANYQLVAGPGAGNGTLVFNGNGTYTFAPGTDFDALAAGVTRNVTFTYTSTDNDGGVSATRTVTLTVTGTNDAPVATDATAATGENSALSGSVPVATDVDGTIAGYQLVSGPGAGNGALVFNSDGTYTFSPGTDFDALASGATRVVTFTYTATDNLGAVSTPRTVTITVGGTNDLPVATDGSASTDEDTPLTSSVPVATDVDGTIAGYQLVTGPGTGNGTLLFNGNGTYTFTPGTDFDGLHVGQSRTATFTYSAIDDLGGASAPRTITITVAGRDDPMTFGGATSGSGNEDASMSGTLTVTDPDGAASPNFTVTVTPAHGTATIGAGGTWVYTPAADYHGVDSFTVRAVDDAGTATAQVISVVVASVPDIANDSVATAQNTALVLPAAVLLANDSFEGSPVVTGAGVAAHGTVVLGAGGTITYTPTAGYTGTDAFTYTVTSGGVTETATVTVNVADVTPPAAPVVLLDPASDGGSSPTDGKTPDTTPTVIIQLQGSGLAAPQPGDVVRVFVDGVPVATVTLTPADIASGLVPVTLPVQPDGSHGVTVTVTDVSGNVSTTSAPLAILVDTLPPVLASVRVDGPALVIGYDESGSGLSTVPPQPSDYTVVRNGTPVAVLAVTVDPVTRQVTLTLDSPTASGDDVRISYGPSAGTGLADIAGNRAAPFASLPVRNDTALTIGNLPQLPATPAPAPAIVIPASPGDSLLLPPQVPVPPPSPMLGSLPFILPSLSPNNGLGNTPSDYALSTLQSEPLRVASIGTDPQILESLDRGFAAIRDDSLAGAGNGAVAGQGGALTVLNGIPNLMPPTQGMSYTVPRDAFVHSDPRAVIKLEARQVDGTPLPGWLGFDGITGLFNGSPGLGETVPRLQVEVLARDDAGREARTNFTVLGSDDSIDRGFPVVRMAAAQLGFAADSSDMLVRFQPLPELTARVGEGMGFNVPSDAFAHTNPRAVVRLQAGLLGGEPLPEWIQFDPVTGRLSGTPPAGFVGRLDIQIVARDTKGLQARTTLVLTVVRDSANAQGADLNGDDGELQLAWREQAGKADRAAALERGDGKDAGTGKDKAVKGKAKRTAAPSFADQLRSVREQGPAKDGGSLVSRALASRAADKPAPPRQG
jgi:VCBS repeat-containing protein